MAIADIAASAPGTLDKGPDCTVCQALTELPPADAQGLLSMLSDRQRRYTEIEKRISADEDTPQWVRSIAHRTYARHAKGECQEMRRRGERLR